MLLHPTIKFTSEISKESINFLDTTVNLDSNRNIITTLYNKPTDTHLFLHHSSANPESVTKKGPYGQYLRIRTLDNADKLTEYYKNRGYTAKQLYSYYARVSKFSQRELLETSNKTNKNTPPVMVTRYNPKNS